MRIEGYTAIEFAEDNGLLLNKHTDPTEGARKGLTPDEARAVAREDARLIFIDALDFELTFEGHALAPYFPAYERHHASLESAQSEARRVWGILEQVPHPEGGTVTASHNPQIYGPGNSLHTVRWGRGQAEDR